MRRITLALVSTVAVLVLLFSYRTSTSGLTSGNGTEPPGIVAPAGAPDGTGDAAGPTAAPTGSAGSPGGSGPSATGTVTVNGSAEDNGYGPVQVRLRVSAGRIVDVTALSLPTDGHSRRINSYAVPRLRQEVLDAQSAHVDTITGATATSDAYRRSVQAALDAAHLGGS